MIGIMIILIAIGVFFFILGYNNKAIGIKILGYGITLWQLLIGLYIAYMNELGESFSEILRVDFIGLLLITFGMMMTVLIQFMLRMINTGDDLEEETDSLKWQGKGNWDGEVKWPK